MRKEGKGEIIKNPYAGVWRCVDGGAHGYEGDLLLLSLARYSTRAYHAPPRSVSVMPSAFVGVIVRLKRETEKRIVRTCLTFAADRCGQPTCVH